MRAILLGAGAAGAVTPVVADLAGYPFEVAPMLMGLSSCIIVRVYMGLGTKTWQGWLADATITALTLVFTIAALQEMRPNLLMAAVVGTGLGAIGAGLISIAESKARSMLGDSIVDTPQAHTGRALNAVFGRTAKTRPPEDQIDLLRKLDPPA